MVLAGRTKLRVSKYFFSGGHLFVFVEYLCNRSPKLKTKNIKNYSSILAIVNHWNWLDDSRPLTSLELHQKRLKLYWIVSCFKLLFYFGIIFVAGAKLEVAADSTFNNHFRQFFIPAGMWNWKR